MHPGEKLVYEISVYSPLRDPIMGSGSLPAEDLKWMSSLVGSVELTGVSAGRSFSVEPRSPHSHGEFLCHSANTSEQSTVTALAFPTYITETVDYYCTLNTTSLRNKW
jgi:hypothetical protein